MTWLAALGALLGAAALRAQAPGDTRDVPRISVEECHKGLAAGTFILVDVRGPEAYRNGHVAGAIEARGEALKARAEELRKAGKTVVTYCS
jgi:rhodanese-related sulfurtransferase